MSISQSYKSDFFSGKRPWSLIKDEILKMYLPPYLKKVNTLNRGIIIVDGFAGPGIFDDGTIGSPIIIYEIVKSLGGKNIKIILVNKELKHHLKLNKILADKDRTGNIITIHGTAEDLLKQLKAELTNETLFVYLDQFGISGFDFNTLVPYLTRTKAHSTEFLMNICVPVIHRISRKRKSPMAGSTVYGDKILTSVFGGDYWKNHLFDSTKTPDEQINSLMIEYSSKLRNYLNNVGFCPVFEKGPGSQLKYYLIFASRHVDAAILLNDIMFKAFWKHIWNCTTSDTLFQDTSIDFVLPCNYYSDLRRIIIDNITKSNRRRIDLWKCIINEYFMKFHSSDYIKEVKSLVDQDKISFIDVKGTGRLNNDSILKLK